MLCDSTMEMKPFLVPLLTKNWNRRMEQKAEELYKDGWCTCQITVFSRLTVFMVLKYTETGNILKTWKLEFVECPWTSTTADVPF